MDSHTDIPIYNIIYYSRGTQPFDPFKFEQDMIDCHKLDVK